MIGLVGILKKKLDLDGKLPDKWKDSKKFSVKLNNCSIEDDIVSFSPQVSIGGTDGSAVYYNIDLTKDDSYGFIEVILNPAENETLSLVSVGKPTPICSAELDSAEFNAPCLTALCANDGGNIRFGTSIEDNILYTDIARLSYQGSSTIPDGFYAVCIENSDAYYTYIRTGDNELSSKNYVKVTGNYGRIRIIASGQKASEIKIYSGNVWKDPIEDCTFLGSI